MNLYFRLFRIKFLRGFAVKLGIWDTCKTPYRVWPTDLDVFGHMTNSRYLALMDLARMDLMYRSRAWGEFTSRGWFPVVAGQTISYFRSLQPWQRFEIHTRVLGLDDRWTYIEQRFVSKGKVYALAIMRSRFLKKSGGSVEHDELEEIFQEIPGEHQIPDWIKEWASHSRPIAVADMGTD